jgi:hypothetical protein
MPATTTWPETAKDVAFATRVVLLTAAARTCKVGSCSPEQKQVLGLVQEWTDDRYTHGKAFPQFLDQTKQRVVRDAENRELEAVATTIADIGAAQPCDPIATVYARLLELAGEAYAATPLERPLDPELIRNVLLVEPDDVVVRGGVRKYENKVELMVYLRRFDLEALTLVPRILAHELICHAGARDTGAWPPHPDLDVRAYFTEGFMDRAAWRLFSIWREDGHLQSELALEQLSGTEFDASADRPDVFPAGRSAFERCYAMTKEHMNLRLEGDLARQWHVRRDCEQAAIRAALWMNTCRSDVTRKDRFAHYARVDERAKAAKFGLAALDELDPEPLLDEDDDDGSAR